MLNYLDVMIYVVEVVCEIVGVVDLDVVLLMVGEDFSYMLESCFGVYIFIGNGDSGMLYIVGYNFDDGVILVGLSWYVWMVEMCLFVVG